MFAFAGKVTLSPVLVVVKLKDWKLWLMLLVWVTDASRNRVTLVIEAAFGVPTNTVCP